MRWCFFLLTFLPSVALSCPTEWSLRDWRRTRSEEFSSASMPRTLGGQVLRNRRITASYARLSREAQHPFVRVMSELYAEASHQLGRVVRAQYWKRARVLDEDIVRFDLSFLRGRPLTQLSALFPLTTALKLLDASEDLHHELTAFLVALDRCGEAHVATLVRDADLRASLAARSPREALQSFVSYEQRYLQKTLYADWQIATLTRQGVIDPMRFIPFGGEMPEAFDQWCRRVQCGTTSLDLRNRIRYDRELLTPEIDRRSPSRWRAARVEEVFALVDELMEVALDAGEVLASRHDEPVGLVSEHVPRALVR